jgi:hypothetical protein
MPAELVTRIPIVASSWQAIPNKKTRFLPYISPILVSVRQPITMPNKKKEPNRPTL